MRLLVVHNASHHADNVLRLVVEIVRAESEAHLVVICENNDVDRLRAWLGSGTQIVCREVRVSTDATAKYSVRRYLRGRYLSLSLRLKRSKVGGFFAKVVECNSFACFYRQWRVQRQYEKQIHEVECLFDQLRPDVVLAWGDRHLDLELPVLAVAKRRNIRVVLPYVSSSSSGGALWSRKLFGGPKRWVPFSLYRLLANIRLPAMTKEGYFFYEPHILLALGKLGVLSKNPWTIGCGLSDVVCVDTLMTFNRYRQEGVPSSKLQIVGSPDFDALYRGLASRVILRKQLVNRYRLIGADGLIVVALPQFAEQGILPWDDHWTEIRYILAQLVRTQRPILISLHPRTAFIDYQFLEREFDVKLSTEPLRDILPAADQFLAANSSTLIWAVLCGIPSMMLDFYGLDSEQFATLNSITSLTMRERLYEDISAHLNRVPDFKHDWELLSRERIFDGNVLKRYQTLLQTK